MARSLLRFSVLVAFVLTVEQVLAFTHSSVVQHAAIRPRLYQNQFSSVKTVDSATSTTRLQLSPSLVSSITSPLAAVSVLAFVVLFHEAGHYLAAKSLGITVEEFSVGVGPKIAGFVTGEEEFSLRAVPLGGYVRFPENYNTTLVQQQELDVMEARRLARNEKKKKKLQEQPSTPRSPLFQKLFSFGNSKRLQEEVEQEKQKQSWWSKMFANKNKKPNTQSAAIKDVDVDYYDDPDLLQNRPWVQRAMVLSGGIVFNFVLAFLCYFGEITVGNGLPHPVLETGAVVASMRTTSSPSAGILKPGDVIMGINGVHVSKATSMTSSQRAISALISDIRTTPIGDSVHLEVKRPSEPKPMDVVVKPQPMATQDAQQVGPQSIGVMLAPNYVGKELIRTRSPGDAAVFAGRAVVDITKETAESLSGVLGQLLTPNAGPPTGQMSGPIGLIRAGSDVVKRNDVGQIVSFAAAVSVNLAVINALPLPALDGGQLVFVAAEAVTRKKVDQRLQEGITAATLLFLLVVSVGTAVGDVESIFSR